MDSLIEILTNYGYVGMLISAFLAGSIFPLSSEVVMLALLAAGLDPWQLVIYGTIGNVLGSMLNYGIGMLGRIDWIEKYLHVNKKNSTEPNASWPAVAHGWAFSPFFRLSAKA